MYTVKHGEIRGGGSDVKKSVARITRKYREIIWGVWIYKEGKHI